MAEIEFRCPNGTPSQGYFAEPASLDKVNSVGVVIVHEMWGITPLIKEVADRFAQAGYRTLIPDLFGGRTAETLEQGLAMMGGLDFANAANQLIAGGALWLRERSKSVAAVGFCMGGAIALLAAGNAGALDAVVSFYGIPPAEAFDPATIRIPVACHFGQKDAWCTPSLVDALESRLRAGGVNFELFRYDAGHAFMNKAWHEYDPAATESAWARTLDFLSRTSI